jgi:hypothetical protein
MYHDQGLPVLKHATFGRGVNITLGLPLIRTSVDHGTALDLAAQGLGLADCGSMEEAIRVAMAMAHSAAPTQRTDSMKHVARKRFGQNFLTDKYVLSTSSKRSIPRRGDAMVEIGPGLAAMTALLLKQLEDMHVVELDRDLVARLEKAYPREKLTIHSGDALKFDFGAIPVPEGQKLRMVGNLPYNISSPLLFHLASSRTWSRTSISCCKRKWWSAWWPNRAPRPTAACR